MRGLFFSLFFLLASVNPAYCQQNPKAYVSVHEGLPTLFIDNKPHAPFAYTSYLGETQYYKQIEQTGIQLYSIPAYLGDRGINTHSKIGPFRSPIWVGEGRYDFSSVIEDFDKILAADKQARVIVRLHLDPPLWWETKYPASTCLLPDGSSFRQCFFSDDWRKQSSKVLTAFINWLEKSVYADHFIGIHVAAGGTEEWVYHYDKYFYDENPARKKAFQHWLKNRYKKNKHLQKAWNNELVTFGNSDPADISGEHPTEQWLQTPNDQPIIDTYKFHAETLADNIAYFCRVVKKVSNRRLLTGAFYGYHYFIADPRKGHGALTKLLQCPDLDYISSPNDYKRVAGEDWSAMAAIQSVQLHGKLWMSENDTRTTITTLLKDRAPHVNPPGNYYDAPIWLGPESMAVSEALLWKNLGRMLAQGYGGWWFDMWGGWFDDPRLLAVFKAGQTYFSKFPSKIEEKMLAQVGVIVDEELCFRDASMGRLANEILSNRYSLGKSAAPYDLFLVNDLDRLEFSRYKVIWLMGVNSLKQNESTFLSNCRNLGITVIWTKDTTTTVLFPGQEAQFYPQKVQWSGVELRALWQQAGVHLYLNSDDILNIGHRWISIHSITGGQKQIQLPFNAKLIDPLTNTVLQEATDIINVNLLPASTRIFYVVPF